MCAPSIMIIISFIDMACWSSNLKKFFCQPNNNNHVHTRTQTHRYVLKIVAIKVKNYKDIVGQTYIRKYIWFFLIQVGREEKKRKKFNPVYRFKPLQLCVLSCWCKLQIAGLFMPQKYLQFCTENIPRNKLNERTYEFIDVCRFVCLYVNLCVFVYVHSSMQKNKILYACVD